MSSNQLFLLLLELLRLLQNKQWWQHNENTSQLFVSQLYSFKVPEGARFRRMELTSTAAGSDATVSKAAADRDWKNTQNIDTNKKKDKPKKKYTQEQKVAYNKKKNDKKREKRKMAMKTFKMAQTMIDNDEKHNEEMEKLRKELAQVKRHNKEMDKKLDTIKTQTKKKTPVKRLPKPKDDESGPKKKVFTATELKKLVLHLK